MDGSIHGLGLGHGIVGLGHGLGHLGWLHHVHRRSLWGVNPNALNVPLDTAHVAHAKAAQLV
ncbi:hypothetical protein, partial [Neisseria meningitidis]|uniref:hypothetical protein n=1 Tax=Neisseria meningitidis TaxID=487 RepID=UPI001C56FA08